MKRLASEKDRAALIALRDYWTSLFGFEPDPLWVVRWFEMDEDDVRIKEGMRVTSKWRERVRKQGIEKLPDDMMRYCSGAIKGVRRERERAAKIMMGGA